MIKHYYVENGNKVYFTKEQEEKLTYGRLSKELIGKVGAIIPFDVTCKVKKGEKFEDIEVTNTYMYLQRNILGDYQNCYVYVDKQGNYYIEENDSTITYYFEYKEEFIPLIPLAGKDLEIINRRYNVKLGGDEQC